MLVIESNLGAPRLKISDYQEHAAPSRRSDFEVLLCNGAGGARLPIFLVERKTFQDFFESQRDGRLQSQLDSLEGANEYRGRLLIVEATDAEWRQDARPAECQDLEGVQTMLESLQLSMGAPSLQMHNFLKRILEQPNQSGPGSTKTPYG